MEVKIGITDIPREVNIDTTATAEELTAMLREAVQSSSLLELADEKGRRILIPGNRIAYLDLGSPSSRTVGFGAV
ncbi:MAG TPA: DUF3107 domain-containing protein [Arachnia sp.]|jgi:hypothetical protein|nr:DUF3107 domain-containing protein [Arachnia sp.]